MHLPRAMHLPLITTTSFVCTGASSPLAVMDPYVILQYLAAGALPLIVYSVLCTAGLSCCCQLDVQPYIILQYLPWLAWNA